MRKTPVPRREIQILKRLREAREKLGLTQPAFAAQIEISKGRLANYEYMVTPLPCGLALRICHQFILSERWLATGQGPMRQYLCVCDFVRGPISLRMPFGEVYDSILATYAEEHSSDLDIFGEKVFVLKRPPSGVANEQFYKNYINMLLDSWMELLKKNGKQDDFGKLVDAVAEYGLGRFRNIVGKKSVKQ